MRKALIVAAMISAFLIAGCAQDERVTKLAEQLQRMDSDTKVGINIKGYGERLRELNFALEQAESAKVGPDSFRAAAKEAVAIYKDAGAIWAMKIGVTKESLKFSKVGDGKKPFWHYADQQTMFDEVDDAELLSGIISSRMLLTGKTKSSLDEVMQELWKLAKLESDKALKAIE